MTNTDQFEIHQTVLRYCQAVDRLDFDGLRAVYTDDGIDHHRDFDGPAVEFIAWLEQMLPRLDGTMHFIGNHLSEVVGDEAVAESYCIAVHWGSAPNEAMNFTIGVRYIDHFARTSVGWRIRERFAVREWFHSDAGLTPAGMKPRTRESEDVYATLRRHVLRSSP